MMSHTTHIEAIGMLGSNVRDSWNCWYWTGSYSASGYGQVWSRVHKGPKRPHRIAYELLVGPIPEGLQLDHLCRVRGCVNPDHLRIVTCRENSFAPGARCVQAINAAKTHCPVGHSYDKANTYHHGGRRSCLACQRVRLSRRDRRISARGATPTPVAAYLSDTGKL